MVLLQFLSLHDHPILVLPSSHGISCRRTSAYGWSDTEKGTNFRLHGAVDRDSEFEIDSDKAREALRKLDQQLQTLSQKQINSPKIRASDLSQSTDPMVEGPSTEVSDSFLAYTAFYLLLFTVFYNVLFLTVIKPSIDGPEPVLSATPTAEDASERVYPSGSSSIPEFSVQP